MVNVMVFAPSPDLMEPMRKLAQEYGSDEVNIDVIHRFGTPEILWQLDRYDVIVARGITYNKIYTPINSSIYFHICFFCFTY